MDTIIIKVIFEFVSNLIESGFPLEARVGIEDVRRFKQSINSVREKPEVKSWKIKSQQCKPGSEKPEVGWLPHFAGRRMSGNGLFRQDPP
jgi:hypothetical protein